MIREQFWRGNAPVSPRLTRYNRHIEGLEAPVPGHWTPSIAHGIPVDHES